MMNIQEAIELQEGLRKLELVNPLITLNQVISGIGKSDQIHLPKFLDKKFKLEQSLLEEYKDDFFSIIPLINDLGYEKVLTSLIEQMREMI
jgi:hypothetical protein